MKNESQRQESVSDALVSPAVSVQDSESFHSSVKPWVGHMETGTL
jgi:hypothetical protein